MELRLSGKMLILWVDVMTLSLVTMPKFIVINKGQATVLLGIYVPMVCEITTFGDKSILYNDVNQSVIRLPLPASKL